MSAGERLATLTGPTAVLGIQPKHTAGQQAPQTVYNLEVQGQHVFRVTSNGLLVHNDCPTAPKGVTWATGRKNYWKQVAASEVQNTTGKYSIRNLQRMVDGKAPLMKVSMKNRTTGQIVIRDVSIELHHNVLTQRGGSIRAHEAWNLVPVSRWAHEGMDEFRHAGWDLLKILRGPNSY